MFALEHPIFIGGSALCFDRQILALKGKICRLKSSVVPKKIIGNDSPLVQLHHLGGAFAPIRWLPQQVVAKI